MLRAFQVGQGSYQRGEAVELDAALARSLGPMCSGRRAI